ncbi:imm68 putative immunity domain-containing protein [Capnocytophaga felis]|uniref:Uncharacterized protein n=1 Tax=Capnocytophaga felis TaxID=2267611 RepID=A0A5M4B9G2_9FLAO|nr:imm68 putative immunity domain-containing protein [Capnocytophaga felis]GET45885.1 hypothetical protein RCZ01_11870 [Capnocytophaga felis]GET49262.1 hypothetical protein RCZ02_20930 [Capnocytophaga felis]
MSYITDLWNEWVSDDALLLLDYFKWKNQKEFTLSEIIRDIHLESVIEKKTFKDGDLYYKESEDFIPHFNLSTSVLVSLAMILSESLKEGKFTMKNEDNSFPYDITIRIIATKEEVQLIKTCLDYFINNVTEFEEYEFIESYADDYLNDCRKISNELSKFY